jgi:hypothetical protein
MDLRSGLAVCLAVAACTGCALFKPVKDKLDLVVKQSACDTPARTLLVLLPGRFDDPKDLIDRGFVDAVRTRQIHADIVIPDLHFGYYLARTAIDRLHLDVVAPARNAGYEQLWLAGISLGGLGALLHGQHYGPADGMVLIAPYLGAPRVHEEIWRAGGLRQWNAETSEAEDYERALWDWLRGFGDKERGAQVPAPMFIGYGTADRFASANRLLASSLPDAHEIPVEGGHDWTPWLHVWERFLEQAQLPECQVREAQREQTRSLE